MAILFQFFKTEMLMQCLKVSSFGRYLDTIMFHPSLTVTVGYTKENMMVWTLPEVILVVNLLLRLAAVCGNGGYLLSPGCFQGFYVDRKIKSEQWMERSCRVVSAETAERLRQLCVATVEKGTGQAAMPAHGGAGGKTSSAQTGVFTEDGREVLNTYFAGFFPAEEPRFAIAVFAEDGISGGKTCAPVFRQICQSVLSVKKD